MKITPAIVQREFIGLHAKVVGSSHRGNVGIGGRVIDETRNTIIVKHEGKKKIIAKNTSVFDFTMLDGTRVEIDGKVIIGRPEDRIKKRIKRLW